MRGICTIKTAKLPRFCISRISHCFLPSLHLLVTGLLSVFILKDKRGNLQEHEQSALREHMLLVLEKNFQLEEQVSLCLRVCIYREAVEMSGLGGFVGLLVNPFLCQHRLLFPS